MLSYLFNIFLFNSIARKNTVIFHGKQHFNESTYIFEYFSDKYVEYRYSRYFKFFI